jgi:hypothetical protein
MELIITDALPPAQLAQSLGHAWVERYRPLIDCFNARQARAWPWPVNQMGCTPAEGLMLESAGFRQTDGMLSAGLGPFYAGLTESAEPVWIADFSSTVITQQRAAMIALDSLNVTPEQAQELTETVKPLFADAGDGIWIEPLTHGRWRVNGRLPKVTRTISPIALEGMDIGDWWPASADWQPWRKRLNEIQMAWHEHPVNDARQDQGLAPINGLWLYGGSTGWPLVRTPDERWVNTLSASARRGDWSTWLDHWAGVSDILMQAEPDSVWRLTGSNRGVDFTNAPKRWWQSMLRQTPKDAWRSWWNNPA